jgi:hypothetical protein
MIELGARSHHIHAPMPTTATDQISTAISRTQRTRHSNRQRTRDVAGRAGEPGAGSPVAATTGVATLRRNPPVITQPAPAAIYSGRAGHSEEVP